MACLNGKSRQEKTTDQQDTDSVILELMYVLYVTMNKNAIGNALN